MKSQIQRIGRAVSILPCLMFSKSLFAAGYMEQVDSAVLSQQDRSDAIIFLIIFVSMALVISFLCSVAETVLLSITPSYIEGLRDQDPDQAARLKLLRQDKIDRSLAAILTMNTVAHTVGAVSYTHLTLPTIYSV